MALALAAERWASINLPVTFDAVTGATLLDVSTLPLSGSATELVFGGDQIDIKWYIRKVHPPQPTMYDGKFKRGSSE